jgi:hypothetical protein
MLESRWTKTRIAIPAIVCLDLLEKPTAGEGSSTTFATSISEPRSIGPAYTPTLYPPFAPPAAALLIRSSSTQDRPPQACT